MWRIKPPPTGGRFSSSRCPYLCSPFLDSAAACKPAPLTTLHSVIATIVAQVCSGWNHRPVVSLVCTTCQRTCLLSSFVEGGGVEPPAHPKLFGESSPLWSDTVSLNRSESPHLFRRWAKHSPYSKFPVCANYSGFYLPITLILGSFCGF